MQSHSRFWIPVLIMMVAVAAITLPPTSAGARVSPTEDAPGGADLDRTPVETPGDASDVKNLATGLFYDSVALALADPLTLDGHTLEVQSSYAEGLVDVNKAVTIQGLLGSEVITPTTNTGSSGDARGWFLVTVPGVTIKNLNFDGTGFLIQQAVRCLEDVVIEDCSFSNISYSLYTGIGVVGFKITTVNRCSFANIERIGIILFGLDANGFVNECTYTGKGIVDGLDYGIELGGGAIAALYNNTITNCLGVASSDGSTSAATLITTYFGLGTMGDVSHNFLNNNTAAIAAGYDAADESMVMAYENDFSGNLSYGVENTSSIRITDASANWWGTNDRTTVASLTSGTVDYTPWTDVGTDTSADPGFQPDLSTLHVDAASPQLGSSILQEAIQLVSGSTVIAGPGTYVGGINLNKSVTLLGAQSGVPACGRVVGPPNPAVESIITGGGTPLLKLLGGCAGSVIDGFAFIGGAKGIESSSGPINNVQILNNHIAGFTGSGVFLNDSGTDITVDQNNIDGSSQTGAGGIFHLDQDNFDGLHFTSNCVLNSVNGTGLFVDGNHNVGASGLRTPLIDGNQFTANNTGTNLGRFAFEFGTISNNTFSGSGFDGLQGGIQNTAITGNTFSGNGRFGLALTGFGGSSDPTRGAQNCTITGNSFTSNVSAGLLFSGSQYPGTISTNIANNNNFTGNIGPGASYSGTETLDLTCNWWSDLGGPDYSPTNPNPPGDAIVAASALFAPWLNGAAPGGSCDQYGNNTIAANTTGLCISTATTCVTVPVEFNRLDASPARAVSVTIQLSSNIELCGAITQGTWIGPYNSVFQVIDNTGGSYTVDQSILGTPCGITTGGTLFTVPVRKTTAAGDGTGTITVTAADVRDCGNPAVTLPGIAGAPASIPIDITAPAAVALTAAQDLTSNGTDGTTSIDVTVPNTVVAGDEVRVYRKGFGNYPEYDDPPSPGAVPMIPTTEAAALGTGWTLAFSTTGPYPITVPNEPTTRDFWYYVAFAEDPCGNVGGATAITGGNLNYHLGDVTDGTTPGNGDNFVDGADISALGTAYGQVDGGPFYQNYIDVGPTTDGSTRGRPITDNQIEFEDLILFAINYGNVSLNAPAGGLADVPDGRPVLLLRTEATADGILAHLVLEDNAGQVKGIHAVLEFDPGLSLVAVEEGALLQAQGQPVFFRHLEEAGAGIHTAVLGNGIGLHGTGDVATVRFRGRGEVRLGLADLRDLDNHAIGDPPQTTGIEPAAVTPTPERFELLAAQPNPFNPSTTLRFRLPQAAHTTISIYDVSGQLVRTLVDGDLQPGEHTAFFDGRNARGQTVSSGVYLVRMRAGSFEATQKLHLLK